MTQEEVIKLAQEAGFGNYAYEAAGIFARFAAIVAATERKKCTNTQEFVTLPREVVEQALEALINEGEFRKLLKPLIEKSIDSIRAALDQPQAEQPAMTPIAQRKLDSLLTEGYTISGYSVYHEQKHQHGFVTGAGLVGWWKPEGVEYPQPRGERDPVAEITGMDEYGPMLGWHKHWAEFPIGTKLYTHPQNLNCKSVQDRLATMWGYVKEQPKREPLTDNQIDKIAESMPGGLEGFLKGWGWRQFARAVLENDHNIK